MNAPTASLEQAHDFLNELAEKPPIVPYEPELLPMLFNATREDSSTSLDDIAKLVERSQNLAARLLNIANSAYYVLEFKVTSLSRAISVLGLREVRSLVLMAGMVAAVKGVKLPSAFDAQSLWRHHIKTASLAKALASALNEEAAPAASGGKVKFAPDEAYVAGLLHDLGKVFLGAARPKIWEAVMTECSRRNCSFAEAENAYWGIDHGIVAARVLNAWKVPLLLTDAINWHHAPALAPEGHLEAGLLAAADTLVNIEYAPGAPLAEDILALLPPGVDGPTLAGAMEQRLSKDRGDTLVGMF